MTFASLSFLIYFLPITVILCAISPAGWRKTILLTMSVIFYLASAGAYDLLLLLFVATSDYLLARWLFRTEHKAFVLALSVTINVSILVFYKYAPFFAGVIDDAAARMFSRDLQFARHTLHLVLPLGISFFVFETLAYIVDIYRGTTKPARRWTDYATYLTFFPHLIAGPIYRYSDVAKVLSAPLQMVPQAVVTGLFLFAFGLWKKVFVANPMGEIADIAFGRSADVIGTRETWLGALAYTFQIYFDFSGYSTMAIGLGRIFGIPLPENFNEPYTSRSITDFWRRWHMSLAAWLRDYVYIPLGGNREGPWRTYRNLIIVFVLCGLWHGANYTFLLWGLMHGALLIAERAGLKVERWLPGFLSQLVCFFLIVLTWVMFRADTVTKATAFYHSMFVYTVHEGELIPYFAALEGPRAPLAASFGLLSLVSFRSLFSAVEPDEKMLAFKMAGTVVLVAVSMLILVAETFNPFIYYRF
jgi:alginate O-acetyltransferase complex protein AlgI